MRRVQVTPADALLDPYRHGLAAVLNEVDPDLSLGSSSQTWIMAATVNVLFEDEPATTATEGGFVTVAFERCLTAVNLLTQTSRLVATEIESHPVTKDSLDPEISWFEIDPTTGAWNDRRVLQLHTRQYNPVFTGHDAQAMHREIAGALGFRLASEASAGTHPLVLARSLALQAQGERRRGDATSAVVTLQIAAEGVLRGLHRLLLVDAGKSGDEVAVADAIPFETVIRSSLPALLGGRWTGTSAAPERYMDALYSLRNRIVHAGREPNWQQIEPAFAAYDELTSFLDDRVRSSWRSHPRALTAWCESWAGGRSKLPSAAREIAASLRVEPQPYWLPHDIAGR